MNQIEDYLELQRQSEADQSNEALRLQMTIARARVEGPQSLLGFLEDRQQWNETPKAIQDLAIKAVDSILGESFEFVETKVYKVPLLVSGAPLSHRIGSFFHKPSNVIFHLIPGEDSIRPLLVARTPLTWRQTGEIEDDRPVTRIYYEDALSFSESMKLRLPSLEEWRYFCYAGAETQYFWGHDFDESYVWHSINSLVQYKEGAPRHKGTLLEYEMFEPGALPEGYRITLEAQSSEHHQSAEKWNAFGLVDTLGNVWEWTKAEGSKLPKMCGGSYLAGEYVYQRPPLNDEARLMDVGFRLVASITALGAINANT